jgi:NADH-ubiquinone oxidoreductase chain 2
MEDISIKKENTITFLINNKKVNLEENLLFKLNNLHSFAISILTLSLLFFIIKPSLLLNSIQLLSLSLYNF